MCGWLYWHRCHHVALGIAVDANGFEIATKITTYHIDSISARDLYKDYGK